MDKITEELLSKLVRQNEDLMRRIARLEAIEKPFRMAPIAPYSYLPYNLSTGGYQLFGCTLPEGSVIKRWMQDSYVATTNNGSNYWTFDLKVETGTAMATITTAADTAGVWTPHEGTIDPAYASFGSGKDWLNLSITKVGSPGNLYMFNPFILFT